MTNFFNIQVDIRNIIWDKVRELRELEKLNEMKYYKFVIEDLKKKIEYTNYFDYFNCNYNFLQIYNKLFNDRQEEYKDIQFFLKNEAQDLDEYIYNKEYMNYLYEKIYEKLYKDKNI
jgi:hypothetical protein